MKKGTLSLLIVLVLCLALSGCGRKGKQGVALTADSTGSVESSSGRNAGENTDDGTAGNTGENADDTTAGNTGKNAAGSTGRNTGRNTGKTDTGSKTDKKTNRKTNKKTNKKTDKKAGQDTDNAADNKSGKNTGKVIAQTTGSSGSTDSSSGGGTDSNAAQNTGSTDSGSDSDSGSSGSTGSSSGGGSGSSSGGGSTTPPVQGIKLIESVADISDVTVEYGTDAAAAAAKLPGTVMLNCRDGSTIKGSVASWEVEASYNAEPKTQTSYTATGKVTIPAGNKSFYGTTLKATVNIIVRGGDTVIKSIKAPGDIEVANGTSEAEAKKRLPSEVELTCVSDNVTFGTVTWNRKSSTSYDAGLIHGATRILYTGTVKIPSGYRLDSSAVTTIETAIIVLEKGNTPKPKNVTSKSATLEIPIPYTTAQDEIKANLPDKVRLYCEDGSVITVAVRKGEWGGGSPSGGSGDYAKTYRYQYCYNNIELPEGYTFDTTIDKDTTYAAADICVKKRDNTKLYAALSAARILHENRIAAREDLAGGENDKIYLADEGTTPAMVTAGIKFIVNGGKNKTAIDEFYNLQDNEFGGMYRVGDFDSYEPDKNQAFVDKRAEEINAATAALRKVLDNNYQIGTCFNTVNIVNNVKALLESESFKKGGNYVYDSANYPMILGKEYMLPQYVTVVVDAKGTKAEVELAWYVSNPDIFFEYEETDAEGNKLRNAVVKPTGTHDGEPKSLCCEVYVVGYQNGNDWVDLNEHVETYNNCSVGAPLYQKTSVNFAMPELISGTENTFTVKAAFPYYNYDNKLVERIEPDRITVKNADNSITWDGEPLLSDITVTGVNTDQDSPEYLPEFTMTATTASLDAIVDQQTTGAGSGIIGKVELSIPADAITLTENAKEQGWYLPEDGLKLEADVNILYPAVTVTDITLQPDGKVDVRFSTKYLSGSSNVQMALLQQRFIPFVDDDDDNSTILRKSDVVSVNSNDTEWTTIDTAGLDKYTYSDYTLWVKVGDGDWLNTGKTCSLSSTRSHAAGLAGLAASPVLELPADGAEEEQLAVTVEDAQLSEDKSRVTVAFRTAHCSGSSVQTALVPDTEDAFDGTAAGSFVAEDVVTVEADGAYTADISASGIPAGDYTVWVKAGDGEWQKSTVTYTHTAADSDTDTDTDSGTNPETDSDANSVTNPGTGSDADPITNPGTDSDADTDTHSGTAAGVQPGGTQDGLVPENNPEPETESKDPTDPDENTQAGHV